jgi:ATP-binding cassette, subfamily C, type I secretion system permease/ATPase
VKAYLQQCREHFLFTGVFSFFVNLFLLAVPLYTLQVFDRVFSSRSPETLLLMTLLAIVALAAMAGLDLVRTRLLLAAGATLDRALGPKVIGGLLDEAARTGRLSSEASLRDVASLRSYLTGPGILALFDAPWAPVFTLIVFLFHPLLGVVALAGAIVLLALAWVNERATRPATELMGAHARVAARFIDASVRNAEAVRALGMTDAVTAKWGGMNDAVILAQLDAGRRSSVITSATRFVRLLIQVAALGTGAYLVIRQQITSGAMIATTLLLARALGPVEAAIGTWRSFIDARSAHHRLTRLLAHAQASDGGKVELPAPKGRIVVENVVFALGQSERPILRGVGFELAAGESLGIIGPSAAGKSTLARILAGVWRPSAGVARLDGADIAQWDRALLARFLGYLPQDVELFPGTVGENIARLASANSDDIVHAAERAHAHEMILRLPKGYETEVGEGGVLLAPGQRQRVALARALFGDPRFVLLDEPNANLDGEGEEALARAIEGLKHDGATLVVISHKPSVVANMDKLLALNAGRVEMFGPCSEVMARFRKAAVVMVPQAVTGGMDGNATRQG